MSTSTSHKAAARAVSAGEPAATVDFFSMFYLPSSSQSYEEDVHLSTTPYIPFQGAASAASAVMGGLLSVIDTALAVMNEEFEDPSDSIASAGTKEDCDDDVSQKGDSRVSSKSSVMRCCRHSKPRSSNSPPASHRDGARNSSTVVKDVACLHSGEYSLL